MRITMLYESKHADRARKPKLWVILAQANYHESFYFLQNVLTGRIFFSSDLQESDTKKFFEQLHTHLVKKILLAGTIAISENALVILGLRRTSPSSVANWYSVICYFWKHHLGASLSATATPAAYSSSIVVFLWNRQVWSNSSVHKALFGVEIQNSSCLACCRNVRSPPKDYKLPLEHTVSSYGGEQDWNSEVWDCWAWEIRRLLAVVNLATMVKITSVRQSRMYGPPGTRDLFETLNAFMYLFGTVLLAAGTVLLLPSFGVINTGLLMILVGVAIVVLVNFHDLHAHLAGIDYNFRFLALDSQLWMVELAAPFVQAIGSILLCIATLLLIRVSLKKSCHKIFYVSCIIRVRLHRQVLQLWHVIAKEEPG